jgi:ankyrin repeat protein
MKSVDLISSGNYGLIEPLVNSGEISGVEELSAAMRAAAARGDIGLISTLMAHGADANYVQDNFRSALHEAVEQEQEEAIRFLVARGANINIPDRISGWTPLHAAVELEADAATQAETPIMAFISPTLLSLGADPLVKDRSGKTPLDLAREYGHNPFIEAVQRRGRVKGKSKGNCLPPSEL